VYIAPVAHVRAGTTDLSQHNTFASPHAFARSNDIHVSEKPQGTIETILVLTTTPPLTYVLPMTLLLTLPDRAGRGAESAGPDFGRFKLF